MRPRHQRKFEPGADVYGSPSMSQPPSQASNSPNGRFRFEAPRLGDAKAGVSILESRDAYHSPPASSITTFAPAWVSAYAAMPPPAPDPTIQTSYVFSVTYLLVDARDGAVRAASRSQMIRTTASLDSDSGARPRPADPGPAHRFRRRRA